MKPPSGWRSQQLSDLADIVRGASPRPAGDPRFFNGDYLPWITVSEITKDARMHLVATCTALTKEGSQHTRIFEPGTLLLTNSGATLGVPKITSIRAGANDGVAGFLLLKNEPEYLYYFLASKTAYFRGGLAPGVGQPNLNTELIGSVPILLPPVNEQKKIAEILGVWDEALEKLDALIAAKGRRKKALMQQLLTGKRGLRTFKGKAWGPLRIGDALKRAFRPADVDEGGILALVSIRRRCGGLFRRPDILTSAYKTQDLHVLETGDFLISKRQVVHGAWSIVEPEFDGTLVSKEYAILVNHAPDKLNMRFFAWLAQTPRMIRLARVASTGVHIEKLIFDPVVFLREKVRIPSNVSEQAAIAAVLDAAETELRLLRQQRAALDQQKRGLMQQLLTGMLRTL